MSFFDERFWRLSREEVVLALSRHVVVGVVHCLKHLLLHNHLAIAALFVVWTEAYTIGVQILSAVHR